MGVFVGIFMGVVGIVPVGMLASLFNGDWYAIGILVFGLALTFGARIIAIMLAAWIDRDEAGINSNSPSLSLAPQPSRRVLVTVLGLVVVGSVGVWLSNTQRTQAFAPTGMTLDQLRAAGYTVYDTGPFNDANAAIRRGDYATALRLLRPMADEGYIPAQNNLGVMYYKGQGVPQNYAEAVKWYRLAADQGDAIAQYNLGLLYEDGRGVPQNYAEAVKWYRFAADQGYAEAQTNLGVMYANGQGVPQNDAEAVRWYRLAADQGNATAQNNLGGRYNEGRGLPQNYVNAHMWFNLAAAQGYQDAVKNRDLVEQHMTPAQIAEAQKVAREWKSKSTPR